MWHLEGGQGFPGGASDRKSACQCRRCRFNPWVGKIPWRRNWQPTPVCLPGKFHGQRSLVSYSPLGLQGVGHNWVTKHTQVLEVIPKLLVLRKNKSKLQTFYLGEVKRGVSCQNICISKGHPQNHITHQQGVACYKCNISIASEPSL